MKAYNFSESFSIEFVPQWDCPFCGSGTLQVPHRPKVLITEHPKFGDDFIKNLFDEDARNRERFFTGLLKCSDKSCDESVIFSGFAINYKEKDETEDNWHLWPQYFTTPVCIINHPEWLPSVLEPLLRKSYGLFWYDYSACANKIRAFVEKLLDERKVKKYNRKNGKLHAISLHNRILEYKKVNQDIGHLLEAVKWVGNVGSHSTDDRLSREDLLDAYIMLEEALKLLYGYDGKHIKRLATKVIKRRGKSVKKRIKYSP